MRFITVPLAVLALVAAGCGSSGSSGAVNPNAKESSPPGDIPDNQAYVAYAPPGAGYSVKVPEGWSRSKTGAAVSFTDKLNTVQVDARPGARVTVAGVKKTDVPDLKKTTRAFKLVSVTTVSLPAGQAVLISYQANSDPNPVTGKQYRLDVLRYVVFHAGTRTTLTLLSPVGADNVDPWRIVTQSLKAA